jgi:hypothetical protein
MTKIYTPNTELAKAWLVDVDGTLALMRGRSPYDWHRVGEDAPHDAVVRTVRALASSGYAIIIMSGRDEVCRLATEKWLDDNVGAWVWEELHMRPRGSRTPDDSVKYELFRQHVAPRYHVVGALDDRNSVVALWREMGLTCMQVAPGDF